MRKKRSPLQASDVFIDKLKELQKDIRKQSGDDKSLRELTEIIAKSPAFGDIEKKILSQNSGNIDINIRFDRRKE